MWAPPGGVEREIQVCLMDAHRLEEGQVPDIRLVRLGNRRVPWFMSGPAYESYALGYYGAAVDSGRLQADRLTGMYGGIAVGGGSGDWAGWSDPGAWDQGGMIGGHDYSGYGGGGDQGGLFDHGGGGGDGGGGGGDGGGGDGGGGF